MKKSFGRGTFKGSCSRYLSQIILQAHNSLSLRAIFYVIMNGPDLAGGTGFVENNLAASVPANFLNLITG
jgi:hypothetical protein